MEIASSRFWIWPLKSSSFLWIHSPKPIFLSHMHIDMYQYEILSEESLFLIDSDKFSYLYTLSFISHSKKREVKKNDIGGNVFSISSLYFMSNSSSADTTQLYFSNFNSSSTSSHHAKC